MDSRLKSDDGYILVEASVVYVILAMAMTALLPLFILCFRASSKTKDIVIATQLSQELLEEVRIRRWDQSTPFPIKAIEKGSVDLGIDAGKNPGDKRSFSDIDDFHNWAESPPMDPGMGPIKALAGFTRDVSVQYVVPTDPNAVSSTPTDYKRVTVCTKSRQIAPLCLKTLLTNR